MSAEDEHTWLRRLTAPRVSLAVYVALGIILAISSGLWYGEIYLFALCLLYAVFMACCVVRPRLVDELAFNNQGALALALLASVVVLCIHPGLKHAEDNAWHLALVPISVCVAVASRMLAAANWLWPNFSAKAFKRTAMAAFVCLMILRLLVIKASPNPHIDVFHVNNRACDLVLEGTNPYSGEYEDIYAGKYGYRPTFFYWPATLYWSLPFRGLLGDVRYGTVLADALTAACLLWAARRSSLPERASLLVPLVWLAFPVSLFVLEQAWVDPLLIVGTAAAVVTLERRNWWLCGLALGWIGATKQYGGLIGVMTLAWLAGRDLRATWRTAAAAAAALAALMAPIVCWDPAAFYRSTIETHLHPPARKDALGILSFFLQHDIAFPPAVFGAVTLAAIAALTVGCLLSRDSIDCPRRWAANLTAAFWTSFLFGKFAFCNYYYLVAFLLLTTFVVWPAGSARAEPSKA